VVIGSGFIGCEAAAPLAGQGLEVTVVSQERVPQGERLGEQAGQRIAGWLRELGVQLIGGASVAGIENGNLVRLDGRDPVWADLVLAATGITPMVPLAEDAGVDLERGRVVVSASMRTSVAGLYAAGDVAHAYNAAAGRHLPVEHWGEAIAMGEVAGASCAGAATKEWAQAPGFWSEIGPHALKYAAWGDGYAGIRFDDHGGGAFTSWYLSEDDRVVGLLTHEADEDYEHGQHLVETGGRLPAAPGRS
jgi:NADPH-dependent 2,4-dienoyl-CoA reductase/sulfur reductase-like enzyme